jgi:hypothetical protein
MTLEGKVLARWGSEGSDPGQFDLPHGIAVDGNGNAHASTIVPLNNMTTCEETVKNPNLATHPDCSPQGSDGNVAQSQRNWT